jgi:hypothetical protein
VYRYFLPSIHVGQRSAPKACCGIDQAWLQSSRRQVPPTQAKTASRVHFIKCPTTSAGIMHQVTLGDMTATQLTAVDMVQTDIFIFFSSWRDENKKTHMRSTSSLLG